ncbi:hypothetical protein PHLGIDRAFT_404183 [Phlebiopsis gigantea 11061_1 CR5-6]|uniref:C2 domain-containing protein n=1 Tax=Phlebiopsis gigantea (strain 11061_1 CR5-6) TaxID=745531 RepID=A0A0C3NRX7_PHLG1|nr:hypothetical protein PHLGIDRAFT_404183 [Phlebiopsis gigantea 11061_1 CR5-6]
MHCNQPDLVARLFAIEIQGLQERHFDLSADTFVTVSVDGEQQIQTELVENNLNPKWKFAMPYTLMVHASSVISFQVYRRRNVAKMFGAKYIGRLEQKLYTFVTNPNVPFDINIRMNTMHWEKAKLMAVIDVDYTTPVETLLDHAEDKLHGATMNATDRDLTPAAEAIRSLGHAIGSLDQLMGFVDGIVDIHPIAKAAWMLLSSVYKAVQAQTAQDSAIKELADSLKETLTHARSCRNVHKIPGQKPLRQKHCTPESGIALTG